MSRLLSVLLSSGTPESRFVEATAGFEPAYRGFADPYVTQASRSRPPRLTASDSTGRLLTADRSAVRPTRTDRLLRLALLRGDRAAELILRARLMRQSAPFMDGRGT